MLKELREELIPEKEMNGHGAGAASFSLGDEFITQVRVLRAGCRPKPLAFLFSPLRLCTCYFLRVKCICQPHSSGLLCQAATVMPHLSSSYDNLQMGGTRGPREIRGDEDIPGYLLSRW